MMAFCLMKSALVIPKQVTVSYSSKLSHNIFKNSNKSLQKTISRPNNSLQKHETQNHSTFGSRLSKGQQPMAFVHKKTQSHLHSKLGKVAEIPSTNVVCLADVYSRDPLAILLQTPLQMHSAPSQPHMPVVSQPAAHSSITIKALQVSVAAVIATPVLMRIRRANTLSGPQVHLCSTDPAPQKEQEEHPEHLPTSEQVDAVYEVLRKSLPRFFAEMPNYSIYDANVVFDNRIRGTISYGFGSYVMQSYALKFVGQFRFARVKFVILKITQHPEEGTVKVRWRIEGTKPIEALVAFWSSSKWSTSILKGPKAAWYDGFSTFHVNSSGKVSCHVAENRMKDDNPIAISHKLGPRVAIMLGLLPKPAHGSVIGLAY